MTVCDCFSCDAHGTAVLHWQFAAVSSASSALVTISGVTISVVTIILVLRRTDCIPRLLLKEFEHIVLCLSAKVMQPNKERFVVRCVISCLDGCRCAHIETGLLGRRLDSQVRLDSHIETGLDVFCRYCQLPRIRTGAASYSASLMRAAQLP